MSAIAAQNASMIGQLQSIARQLNDLPHCSRVAYIAEQARLLAVSDKTLYRYLKQKVGWDSGRKKRSDAGTTSIDLGTLEQIAAMQKVCVRANGKITMTTPVAVSIAAQNGLAIPVSASTITRQMRLRNLSPGQQAKASAHVRMRSLHPNHVHQVDPSLCIIYYMRGKQGIMRDDEFYKNKLDNYAKIKLKVWRYVLYDHYSATLVPWYVEAAGENPAVLGDFLLHAWGKQPGRYFHGVPSVLVWDKGSANTAAGIKSLLDSLGVEHIAHTAGNARAKGGVECGNNVIETQFECRLRLETVNSAAELNAAVSVWAAAYNANLIPMQDTRLRRQGLDKPAVRADLWNLISMEQLRLLPDEQICRDFMRGLAESRKVQGDMAITFRHPVLASTATYDLTGLAGINVGDTVTVQPMVYGDGVIVVSLPRYDGETLFYKAEPLRGFDRAGFHLDAPIFGENFKAKPKTLSDMASDRLDDVAYGDLDSNAMAKAKRKAVPFAGTINAHSHLKAIDIPMYLPKKGNDIATGQRFEEQPMSIIEAAKQLKTALAGQYCAFHLQYLKQHYPSGITASQFEGLVVQFGQGQDLEAAGG